MNNQPSDTQDSLIKTIIQKRKVVYYLVSEDDINSLKTKSWLADTFMLIASVAWGAYFSVHITRATSIQLQDQAIGILNMLLWVFGIAGFFFTLLAVMFLIFAKSTIRRIKDLAKSRRQSLHHDFESSKQPTAHHQKSQWMSPTNSINAFTMVASLLLHLTIWPAKILILVL